MNDSPDTWTESDSTLYQEIAAVAVPARAEQIAALLTLLPFKQDEPFRAVELGCGEGLLSFALLDCFPRAEVVALDGSPAMRAQAARRLNPFGPRAWVKPFDLASTAWLSHLERIDCVVSSLCLHHLDGTEKQNLFAAIYNQLSPPGVFLIADLVAPQRPEARELFAATWDRLAKSQSMAQVGSTQLFDKFVETEWNYYRFDDEVQLVELSVDKPSPLFDQLTWLKTAGFTVVDCFWLQAGHAIYGGYKVGSGHTGGDLPFTVALHAAQVALSNSKFTARKQSETAD